MKGVWPTKPLESLCEDVNVGHVGPSSMHRDPKGIPFLMGKNVGTGVVFTHNIERVTEEFHRSQPKSRLRPGDVVVVRIGKSGQAAKIPDGFGEANCSGLVVIKQPYGIDRDFLVYYLNSPMGRGYSLSQARGATRLTLNTSSVAETLVPVPPHPEQHRIVAILDEAFDGIATAKANAEKNLQNARALFESHLQSVFTERGDGWKQKTLEEIATAFGRGKSRHRPRNAPHLYGGKFPFVQTGDIRNADHVITEYSQTYSDAGLTQSKLWPKGTICITIAANIAETAILGFDACFPDSVIGVVANPKEADVDFIEYLLQSFKARIQSMGKGSAQANINMGTFENERFPWLYAVSCGNGREACGLRGR